MAKMKVWNGRILAIAFLGIFLLLAGNIQNFAPAYGSHQTQNTVWQTVVVSSEPVCTIFHYQLGQKYHIITEEYFKLYEFDTSRYQPECYSLENFDWKYEKPDDLDLLIIVYDRNIGREKLHSLGIGGFYSHSGGDITNNHTIIFCECSTFRYSDPPWILSHELSHFILNYLGFDISKVEDQIHYADFKYDYCMEESYEEFCKSIGTYIEHENLGYKVKVMKPYQPAIGKDLFDQNSEEIEFDSKGLELFKEITRWWHDGIITYSEYSKSMQILTGQDFEEVSFGGYLKDSGTIFLAEPSKEIKKTSKSSQEVYDTSEIIKSFSFIKGKSPNPIFSGKYPDWFKNQAALWTSGKISDEDFTKSVGFLKKSLTVEEISPSNEDLIAKINSLINNGENEKALELVDLAIENNKDYTNSLKELFYIKGTILYNLGQYSNSMVFFDASLKLDSGNLEDSEKPIKP